MGVHRNLVWHDDTILFFTGRKGLLGKRKMGGKQKMTVCESICHIVWIIHTKLETWPATWLWSDINNFYISPSLLSFNHVQLLKEEDVKPVVHRGWRVGWGSTIQLFQDRWRLARTKQLDALSALIKIQPKHFLHVRIWRNIAEIHLLVLTLPRLPAELCSGALCAYLCTLCISVHITEQGLTLQKSQRED